jgi:hypothetical protein
MIGPIEYKLWDKLRCHKIMDHELNINRELKMQQKLYGKSIGKW